ncbi:ABC transporter permease [Phytoactinopolyspora alkaliphila]|uniref:ABC transporter permease n=1 Tax=Phytoactinopolyspora alkaliphila TaxID=1783498 RepID=A0A6N9YN67_9ACTN|nr:ABC transporter permease [Phytoactinopolyspora alkaliphila]NED96288.1 ABC transporter permease [Phytoactinopolyspora alkaliphila]
MAEQLSRDDAGTARAGSRRPVWRPPGWVRALGSSLAQAFVVAMGATFVVFIVMRLIPGDPARILAGPGGSVTAEQVERTRRELGLDQPLLVQYWDWVTAALRGDFGNSLVLNDRVSDLLGDRLVVTAQLSFYAFLVAVVIGLPASLLAARWQGAAADKIARLVGTTGIAVPSFWLALLLIIAFQGVLPTFGYVPAGRELADHLAHMFLPALALGTGLATLVFETNRAGMIDTLGSDYIRTSRAFGVSEWRIFSRYAMRNAFLPTMTIMAIQVGTLMGGALLVENAFALPGMGRLVVQGVLSRDYPVVQACIFVIVVVFVVVNLLTDLLYAVVDPRIRRSRA